MARIAIGGFQHETNTFSPHGADLDAFRTVSAYPRMPRGQALLAELRDLNIGIGGFITAALASGHELVPTLWAAAIPSARVTDEAFEHIANAIVADIADAAPIDAVYLCLHGAMVTQSYEDGEAELLDRVRAAVGPQIPVVVSLDLHSNTTPAMVECADGMVAYRTYPHVDMALTGERAFELLAYMLDTGTRPAKAIRRTSFLIPLVSQCSMVEPAKSIYEGFADGSVPSLSAQVLSASFTPGFPPADIAECGPTVLTYATTQAAADAAADRIIDEVNDARSRWGGELLAPDDAVTRAMTGYQGKPFVLADTQDNPGAGGSSDTIGLLESLIRMRAQDAVFACLYDPDAALAAHAAGVGASLQLRIGGASGGVGATQVEDEFVVEELGDGLFVGTGPMALGNEYDFGPCARLRIGGVQIMVVSGRGQVLDKAILRHVGIEPGAQKILALKSSVHFRADFQTLAEEVLVVVAPGSNIADHRQLPYQNLRPGLDLMP
jgi:microcystin degradation protein MlrC